jgi:hypothetical protein
MDPRIGLVVLIKKHHFERQTVEVYLDKYLASRQDN